MAGVSEANLERKVHYVPILVNTKRTRFSHVAAAVDRHKRHCANFWEEPSC